MQLVETERAGFLHAQMHDRRQFPGGSVTNSVAGTGTSGLSTAFIGRVTEDASGKYHDEAMRASGTDLENPSRAGALRASCSAIHVMPDGARSMKTSPSLSSYLDAADAPQAAAGHAGIVVLEGYLYGRPKAGRPRIGRRLWPLRGAVARGGAGGHHGHG